MNNMDFPHTFKEGNRLEAKKAAGGLPQSIWETYSAFANTDGGMIVLGVEETSAQQFSVTGVSNPDALVKHFWDAVNNPSKTSANILTSKDVRIEAVEDKSIVVVKVPRADRSVKPVYVGGNPLTGTYRRNGEGDYHCTVDEYKAMVRDSSSEPQDAFAVEQLHYDDLCQDTIGSFRSLLAAARPGHPWLETSTEEMLIRLGAVTRLPGSDELKPTRAGLLMFGFEHAIVREFPHYFLDYRAEHSHLRWDDRIVSNDGEWSGNVFDFWLRVSPRLTADLRRPFMLDENMRRIDDTPMHKALREALANTLMHADYYGTRYTTVVKKPDRIEFGNPGGLRVAPEVIMQGGVSDSRNPTIMKMFSLINICEKAGSGYDAIRHACAQAKANPPELSEERNPDRTHLVLHLGEASALVPLEPKGFDQRQAASREEAVINLARERGSLKRVEVETLLGVKNGTAKKLLANMVAAGLLVPEGIGRARTYRPAR